MRFKSIIAAALIGTTLFTSTGCKDDFSDTNTDPSVINKGDIRFLFTNGLLNFEPQGYLTWYYNAAYTTRWVQSYAATGSNGDMFNVMGATGGQGGMTVEVLKSAREVSYLLDNMDPAEAAKYQYIKHMFSPILVYLGMFDTDMYGDMPYTEAVMARYTNPMLLTPKFDTMEELYTIWYDQLVEAVNVLSNPVTVNGTQITQTALGAQDFVYGGNAAKWAKFANSLKLKLAVRLLHQNKAKALAIAKEAAANPAGLMTSLNDDFVYNKGSQEYHFGDDVNPGAPSKQLVDLMINSRDPRVRFFYQKNDFNSKVVQAFFDSNKELPSYIAANVESEVVNGKKVFKAWKGAGEPWVRYYGIPVEVMASQKGEYKDYFDSNLWKISMGGKEKTYTPYAYFNREMVQGMKDYTFPDAPNVSVTQDIVDQPWYGMFYSSAEVNLYLAELKLIGADLPGTAADYFRNGVELSVRAYDKLANLNKIPYYHSVYDANEKSIKLVDGEVETLLANPAYQLTGNKAADLEKVYIQQYIHFVMIPNDQFVSARRSGVPMVNSTILPYVRFSPTVDYVIPRRFEISAVEKSDLMYDIKMAAYARQGFSVGTNNDPVKLNTERVWQDKGAPNFGAGPNF
ncbi:SusD/RagB family nutrient-binding outer membrane lipoprotein [Macellibacteroides fermentans]|uniref:Susd and RagB outer membrane lipoprotein n=1 Tax=Parabacteroides chartae TaxID=1037355 RepID=A0A1T5CTN8_9BACT|nr:SusD/RagB family nutrient-binding outer membrane lipoprotein [Parabacteroides chartae]SKB62888.1 Susd and RagB outer membrane lipoprotein [Parabacteroides chartae]